MNDPITTKTFTPFVVVLLSFFVTCTGLISAEDRAGSTDSQDPVIVEAEEPEHPEDTGDKPFWEWERMTGNWGGLRDDLYDYGIDVDLTYKGEYFVNLRGGLRTHDSNEYNGLVDLAVTMDLDKLFLWKNAKIFVLGQQKHGNGITEKYVGDFQEVSNIDAEDLTRISELWLEQMLFDDMFRLKIGKQDCNTDFCFPEFGRNFINLSFESPPNIPMPTYPDPALGVMAMAEPCKWFSAGGGIYDGDGEGGETGFNTLCDGEDGYFGIVEAAVKPQFEINDRFPGAYKAGWWYHSENVRVINSPSKDHYTGNYGYYFVADQLLVRENQDKEEPQGLGAFLQFSWTPGSRNVIDQYYGGGLAYTGLIPERDSDVTGLAVARAIISRREQDRIGDTHETAIEFFHKVQLTPFLAIQPDIQYIFNPGGDSKTRDALAAGIRFIAEF